MTHSPNRSTPYHRHDVKTADIVNAYASGLPAAEVARQFGVSATCVLRRVKNAGVWRRTSSGLSPAESATRTAIICERYRSGMTAQAVACSIGITKAAVLWHLAKAQCRRRTFSECSHRSGPAHPMWKGGRFVEAREGYVILTIGPSQRVLEHRHVMAGLLGRPLKTQEQVHHINGIRHDNRPENLMVVSPSKHERRTLIKALQRRIRELEDIIR